MNKEEIKKIFEKHGLVEGKHFKLAFEKEDDFRFDLDNTIIAESINLEDFYEFKLVS